MQHSAGAKLSQNLRNSTRLSVCTRLVGRSTQDWLRVLQNLAANTAVQDMRTSLEEERLATLDFLHTTIDQVSPLCMQCCPDVARPSMTSVSPLHVLLLDSHVSRQAQCSMDPGHHNATSLAPVLPACTQRLPSCLSLTAVRKNVRTLLPDAEYRTQAPAHS